MNEIKVFENKEFGQVRTVVIDNEPWFVGKDVALALGYSNTKDALAKHVDEEDKLGSQIATSGQRRQMTVINESGMYSLVLSSKLPTAKKFKHWVTSEVLPSIRKHGAYMTEDILERTITDPDFLIKLLTNMKEEREARKIAEQKVKELTPKGIFADAVSTSRQNILVGELAKLLRQNGVEIGQNKLFAWLRENGYLIKAKRSDYNMPTQRAMDMGLFRIKETVITHCDGCISVNKTVKVTGKGQVYFVNLFLKRKTNQVNR